jgi:hypothetical protein
MARFLSLVSEEGRVLVSIRPTESEDADTAKLRLFKRLRESAGMDIVEIDKTRPLKGSKRNARS